MIKQELIHLRIGVLINVETTIPPVVAERVNRVLYEHFMEREPLDGKILSFNGVSVDKRMSAEDFREDYDEYLAVVNDPEQGEMAQVKAWEDFCAGLGDAIVAELT